MNRTLSQREKVLIFILACTVIISVLVAFVILPGLSRLSETRRDLQKAEATEAEMRTSIHNMKKTEESLMALEDEVSQYSSVFYEPMAPEEADVTISTMVSRYGFNPVSLNMEPAKETSIYPYLSKESIAAAQGEEAPESEYTLVGYKVNIQASGERNQFAALCTEISMNPAMHLVDFDIQNVITEEDVAEETPANNNTTTDDTTANAKTSTTTKSTYVINITLQLFSYESNMDKQGQDEETTTEEDQENLGTTEEQV